MGGIPPFVASVPLSATVGIKPEDNTMTPVRTIQLLAAQVRDGDDLAWQLALVDIALLEGNVKMTEAALCLHIAIQDKPRLQ